MTFAVIFNYLFFTLTIYFLSHFSLCIYIYIFLAVWICAQPITFWHFRLKNLDLRITKIYLWPLGHIEVKMWRNLISWTCTLQWEWKRWMWCRKCELPLKTYMKQLRHAQFDLWRMAVLYNYRCILEYWIMLQCMRVIWWLFKHSKAFYCTI